MRMPLRPRPVPTCLWLILIVLAGASAHWAMAAAASSCPVNQIVLTGLSVVSDRAVLDTTGVNALGGYDLRKGLLASSVTFNDPGWTSSSVATDDEYWVIGLPSGMPIEFAAEFSVSGPWNVYPGVPQGDFTCAASIATDADSAGFSFGPGGCCHGNLSEPLSIPLHALAQQPFHLRLRLASADYRGRMDLTGLLQFTGLPAGVAVVSCQGFGGDATPVRRSTWGSLKSLYH
jgi:hypothetical protein